MGIPAHSSSVPVSAVGAAAAQQSLILPSVQHDSEATVGEKRPAPDSAQELPGPSVGVLPLHMIEEETAGEDGDHAEETPSSPPCSGQQLSAEQYGMNAPAKAARGASRRGPCVKVPQDIWTFLKRLEDPKLLREILDKDAVEGRALPMYTHVCIKCWQLLHLTYNSKKSSWKTSNRVAHAKKVHSDDPDCARWVSKQTSTEQKTINEMRECVALLQFSFVCNVLSEYV